MNKRADFVNGMGCEILELDYHGILVRTDTGKHLLIHHMTDPGTRIGLALRWHPKSPPQIKAQEFVHYMVNLRFWNQIAAADIGFNENLRLKLWHSFESWLWVLALGVFVATKAGRSGVSFSRTPEMN